MRAFALAAIAVLALGCDTLFPEFAGAPPPDLALGDGGADGGSSAPHLGGFACIIGDLRDYRSCAAGAPGVLRITVEETRDVGMTDATGHFTLPLKQSIDSATVAVVDPQGRYATVIIPLRLTNGALDSVALPIVDAATLATAATQNGATLDPQRGVVIGWAVDSSGTPVSNVTADLPIYADGNATNQLYAASATGVHGTVALFNVLPTAVTIGLTPPPSSSLRGDRYTIPVRAGAVTATRLVLVPR
jgi:hypothetical protein